jgi:hypothetical protein
MTQFAIGKNVLLPHDDAARQALAKYKVGDVVDVDILNPINTKFNNLMFAAIGKLAKACSQTTKQMTVRLLVMTGRFQMVQITDHKKVLVADSMSRSSMTQSEREEFWNDLRAIASDQLLPLIDDRAAEEIREMFGDTSVEQR